MGVKESALAAITPISDTDYIRVVNASGASKKILYSDLLPIAKNAAGHNSVYRGKYLGSSISTAQNQAIKDRVYTDMFIGDYWTISGVNYRIACFEYYYNTRGSSWFSKGHIIVVPDARFYTYAMNPTNDTTGGYVNSDMRTNGLASARTTIAAAFGSHVAAHNMYMCNATSSGKPSGWAAVNSDGIELMTERQVYGSPAWGTVEQNGYAVATDKSQFPLFFYAPQFVNITQDYWLQDVRSATGFAYVDHCGDADAGGASNAFGVRPAITLSYV